MTEDIDFSIREKTFEKMVELKKEMDFGEKSWNDWFNHICIQNSGQSSQDSFENKWEKVHYDKFYDSWVQNFALNLNNIWTEPSAGELKPEHNIPEQSAIVIGRGPSIKKHGHLELIANSDYNGNIICTDGALITALKAGITPKKFQKYFVISIDAREEIQQYYDDQIVVRYGDKIKGIFSTFVNPATVERARKSQIKIHWMHTLFDYHQGKKSVNQISALMVRAKNHPRGLPAIQTGGNAGTSAWFISWKILKCSTVALVGINHGWQEDDSWDSILSHDDMFNISKINRESPAFKKLFLKLYNPEFKCYCILDPLFQYYSKALKEFISRSSDSVNTINATEGGSIFGENITCMTLKKFLNSYAK